MSPSSDFDRPARKNDSVDSDTTIVHSYPPTPPAVTASPSQHLSPEILINKLSTDKVSPIGKPLSPPLPSEIRKFLLAPHSHPRVPQPENTSIIAKALSVFKNSTPSHSLSFTLCPVPSLDALSNLTSPQPSSAHDSESATEAVHSKRHTIIAKINDLVPPAPPALLIFHDRTPVWNFHSTTGLVEIDIEMEREMGIERSFWVTVALTYMEFLTEREVCSTVPLLFLRLIDTLLQSYLAAAGGD